MELDDLVPKLKAITGANPEARIFVRGDKNVSYGRIMEVMGTVSCRRLQQSGAGRRIAASRHAQAAAMR